MASVVVKIKGKDGNILEFNRDRLDGFSSLSQSVSNPEALEYGLLPSSGTVQIVADNELENLIQNGIISSNNLELELFLNNKKIQNHITSDSAYDINGKILTLSLSNKLNQLKQVKIVSDNSENIMSVPLYHIESSVKSVSKMTYTDGDRVMFKFTGPCKITKLRGDFTSGFTDSTTGTSYTVIQPWGELYKGYQEGYYINNIPIGIDCIEVAYTYPTTVKNSTNIENYTVTQEYSDGAEVVIHTFKGSYSGTVDEYGNIDASNGIDLYVGKSKLVSLYELMEKCLSPVYTKDEISKMFSEEIYVQGDHGTTFKMTVSRFLYTTIVPFVKLKDKTCYDVIKYICSIGQIAGFEDNDGNLTFKSVRPVFDNENEAIFIPDGVVFNDLDYSLIKNNKYTEANIPRYKYAINKKSIFKSPKIYALDSSFNYIGDDKIKNPPYNISYEIETSDGNSDWIQTVSFSVDLKSIDANVDLKNIVDYSIVLEKSIANMSFTVDGKTLNNGNAEVSQELENLNQQSYLKGVRYTIDDESIMHINLDVIVKRQFTSFISGTTQPINYENVFDYMVSIVANTISSTSPEVENRVEEGLFVTSNNPLISYASMMKGTWESITFIKYATKYSTKWNLKCAIEDDYKDGISSARLKVACSDLYYKNGDVAKKWAQGDILNVGEIIYLLNDTYSDGSQRYWEITGRNVIYNNVPELQLELMECKLISVKS
jgi:hypothetical protein